MILPVTEMCPVIRFAFYDVRLFAERGYDVKYRVRADYEHFLYCIYDRKAEAVYVEMIVADYEGGGFSETRENRRISEKEHAEITKRYLGRDKALRYKLLMLLTLTCFGQSLQRTKNIPSGTTGSRRKFTEGAAIRTNRGRIGNESIMGMQYYAPGNRAGAFAGV